MTLVKRSGIYYLRLNRGGREDWVSTHKGNEREARKAAEQILAVFNREKATKTLARQLCEYAKALAHKEIDNKQMRSAAAMLEKQAIQHAMEVIDKIFPSPGIMAQDLWDKYNCKDHSDIKPKTFAQTQQKFATFIKWAQEEDMRSLTVAQCQKFLQSLNVADQTWNNYISALSAVFSATPEVTNVWRTPGLRKTRIDHKERAIFGIDNLRRLLQWCQQNENATAYNISAKRWAAFIRVLYYTGLRPVDVVYLHSEEITSDGVIELYPEKTSRTRRKVSYKADPNLLKLLATLPTTADGRYFADFDGMFEGKALAAGFRQLCKLAGMPPMDETLYGLRHNFVTFQINAGNDDEAVSAAIGHTSLQTTKGHYYHGRQKVELSELPEV